MVPRTIGDLRTSEFGHDIYRTRTIKDEMRANLIRKLQAKDPIFSGIIGYEETVVPQIINAILSRHNMILLGPAADSSCRRSPHVSSSTGDTATSATLGGGSSVKHIARISGS
jgi:hypothetical protein